MLDFMLAWYERFPQFKSNKLFLAGQSYAGALCVCVDVCGGRPLSARGHTHGVGGGFHDFKQLGLPKPLLRRMGLPEGLNPLLETHVGFHDGCPHFLAQNQPQAIDVSMLC
jgi:hypothetical protein